MIHLIIERLQAWVTGLEKAKRLGKRGQLPPSVINEITRTERELFSSLNKVLVKFGELPCPPLMGEEED